MAGEHGGALLDGEPSESQRQTGDQQRLPTAGEGVLQAIKHSWRVQQAMHKDKGRDGAAVKGCFILAT
jgi:hypothetical protein